MSSEFIIQQQCVPPVPLGHCSINRIQRHWWATMGPLFHCCTKLSPGHVGCLFHRENETDRHGPARGVFSARGRAWTPKNQTLYITAEKKTQKESLRRTYFTIRFYLSSGPVLPSSDTEHFFMRVSPLFQVLSFHTPQQSKLVSLLSSVYKPRAVSLCSSSTLYLWVVMPCGRVGGYQRVGENALKMETVCFFETLVSTYQSTRRHNRKQYLHRREKLKSHLYSLFLQNCVSANKHMWGAQQLTTRRCVKH
jgi:hypothetical protein